ncbi:hypothetical protein ACOSP7_029175 [Xanthoceras sorbifolium]
MIAIGTPVKFVCIIIPSFHYKMPFKDALPLCLIMTCRRIFGILTYYRKLVHSTLLYNLNSSIDVIFNWRGVFHHQGFGFTFSLSYYAPIVRAIYDTLRRHMTYHKRTIQHSKRHSELRIMHSRTSSTWENLSISPPQQTTSWMSSINTRNKDKRLSRRQCFTSLAPYSLMHDDICSLGHEKCTALVIVPFQKSDTVYIRASVLVVQQQGVVVEQVE